jgi:dipeptide/tripeptide permease
MAKTYATVPPEIETMPKGIPYIIGNEAAERFSFYGMRTILTVFMVQYLYLMSDTVQQQMSNAAAQATGGIKPCVSAHVGDQFGKKNRHLLEKVYQWFYFSINFGSTISTMLTPWLLEWYGPHVAFGVCPRRFRSSIRSWS